MVLSKPKGLLRKDSYLADVFIVKLDLSELLDAR